jgi:hypothetical protein
MTVTVDVITLGVEVLLMEGQLTLATWTWLREQIDISRVEMPV